MCSGERTFGDRKTTTGNYLTYLDVRWIKYGLNDINENENSWQGCGRGIIMKIPWRLYGCCKRSKESLKKNSPWNLNFSYLGEFLIESRRKGDPRGRYAFRNSREQKVCESAFAIGWGEYIDTSILPLKVQWHDRWLRIFHCGSVKRLEIEGHPLGNLAEAIAVEELIKGEMS